MPPQVCSNVADRQTNQTTIIDDLFGEGNKNLCGDFVCGCFSLIVAVKRELSDDGVVEVLDECAFAFALSVGVDDTQ